MADGPSETVLDREQVEHLKDALRDTELLMEHGTTNYLEVLTARQSLLAARLSLVSDRNAEIKVSLPFIMHWEGETTNI